MERTLDSEENCHYSLRRLDLYSWGRLEQLLGVNRAQLRSLANFAGRHYHPFPKAPRSRPFARIVKPPKRRIIDNPSEELKAVQSLIVRRLLQSVALPKHICGGMKGKSVVDNVALHRGSQILVSMDIARFFPSITNKHVYQVWSDLLGCSPRISALLTRLTTFERHLPQGAPTSTILANLVLYSCDEPIRRECVRRGIQYSSWVDDLAFSSGNPRLVIDTVVATLKKNGFRTSRKKMRIAGPRAQKILNGVVLGGSLGIPPERLARIRSGIHKLRKGDVPAPEFQHYVQSLRGNINQIAQINPKTSEKFKRDLEAACERLR
jgi:RNA-directed DNA polymerase